MSFLLERKIQWKFNLEKAPWWGGGGMVGGIIWTDDQEYQTLSEESTWKGLPDIWGTLDNFNWSWMHSELQAINLSVSRRSGGAFDPSLLISSKRLLPDTTRSGADNSSTRETDTGRARYLQRSMDHLWIRSRRENIPALRESHRLRLES